MHINNFSDSKRDMSDLISKRTGIAFQRRVVGYQNDFIEIKLGVCLVAADLLSHILPTVRMTCILAGLAACYIHSSKLHI